MSQRFEGQTAVITGGASGLGLGIARRLAGEGARVSLWDRDAEAIKSACEQINGAHSALVEITDPQDVESAAALTNNDLARIDILIASAGISGRSARLWEYPVDEWNQIIDINLNDVFHCCRAVVPFMLKSGYGRIVNIASIAGKEGNPNAAAYSASKAGVIALTKSLAKELADTQIRVNCLVPAVVNTPILKQLSQSHIDYMLSKIPMNRFGTVEEVAAMACWAASRECSFTTGAAFDLSGGRGTY